MRDSWCFVIGICLVSNFCCDWNVSCAQETKHEPPFSELSLEELMQARAAAIQQFTGLQQGGQTEAAIAIAGQVAGLERAILQKEENATSGVAAITGAFAETLQWLASRYEERLQYQDAIVVRQELVPLRLKQFGKKSAEVAQANGRLLEAKAIAALSLEKQKQVRQAMRLSQQGRQAFGEQDIATALRLERQALEMQQDALGEKSIAVSRSHYNLGFLLHQSGDSELAVEHLREAESQQFDLVGPAHVDWQSTIDVLAACLDTMATKAISEEQFDNGHRYRSERLQVLTRRYLASDWQVKDAERDVTDLERLVKMSSDDRQQLSEAVQLNTTAIELFQQRQFSESMTAVQAALKIRQRLLGDRHPLTLQCRSNVGFLQQATGELAKSVDTFRAIQSHRLVVQGKSHPEYLSGLSTFDEILRLLVDRAWKDSDFKLAAETQGERVKVQTELYGTDDYRVVDTRLAAENARVFMTLSAADHESLVRADAMNAQVVQLTEAGRYVDALPLAVNDMQIRKSVLGKDHEGYAVSVANLAKIRASLGDLQRAEPLYREMLSIREALVGKQHPAYASSLNQFAEFCELSGRSDQAEQFYLQARDIFEDISKNQHPEYASVLNNLGMLYRNRGQWRDADFLLRKALQIQGRTFGPQHPQYAKVLNSLAMLYHSMGDYAQAEQWYEQARVIRQQAYGTMHSDYASSLNNLAGLFLRTGRVNQAEKLLLEAIAIRKQTVGIEHPAYADDLSNLTLLYQSCGRYEEAELAHAQANQIIERHYGVKHPKYALSLNRLALLHHRRGDFTRAEPLYLQAIEIQEQSVGRTHPDYANTINNLAGLYQSMGDYVRAEPLQLQANQIWLDLFGPDHPIYAGGLSNLSLLYQSMSDLERAEPPLLATKEIRQRTFGRDHPDYATTLNNLAGLYESAGNYQLALKNYLEAKEVFETVYGPEHPTVASCLNNLAGVYHSLGELELAEKFYLESKRMGEQILSADHPDYVATLSNLAFLYYGMGKQKQATQWSHQALVKTQQLLDSTAIALPERQQLAMTAQVRHRLDAYLSIAASSTDGSEDKFQEAEFGEVLAWKGANLLRQRAIRKLSSRPDIAASFQQLQRVAMKIATHSRTVAHTHELPIWAEQMQQLRAQRERLEVDLSRRSAEFRSVSNRVTLDQLRASMPADSVFVDFLEYDKLMVRPEMPGNLATQRSLVAFVVGANSESGVHRVELGEVEQLAAQVDQWRESYGESAEGKVAADQLRAKIWQPLVPHLRQAKTILVSSDGALGRLPIGALPGTKPDTYLLEEHRIVLVPMLQLIPSLLESDPVRGPPGKMLVMGNVDYDSVENTNESDESNSSKHVAIDQGWDQRFSKLPGTKAELLAIRDLFYQATNVESANPDSLLMMEASFASEDRFRQAAPKYDCLHLATHGYFASQDFAPVRVPNSQSWRDGFLSDDQLERLSGFGPGLLSGLAFSGANRRPEPNQDDGILSADEIAFLPLENVDLVVLSACETGLGAVAGGEGLLGLQRAFQVSGARSVVSSLWEVDDWATQILMERFYHNLWELKLNKLDALREAQLWMLKHPNEIRQAAAARGVQRTDSLIGGTSASPRLWAAFVLSGDWR